jgi:predicted RNase H-like HicB family nuclease
MFWGKKPEPQLVRVQAKVPWLFHFNPKEEEWIAICPLLNLNAAGRTIEELQSVANEATQLLFEDLLESSELEAFLRRNGWSADRTPAAGTRTHFDVPAEWRQESFPQMAVATG